MAPVSNINQQILFADMLSSSFVTDLSENIAVFWLVSSVYPAFLLKELDVKVKQLTGQGIINLTISNDH